MLNDCEHRDIVHYDLAGGDHAICRRCGKMLSINGVPVEELVARQIDGDELLLTANMEFVPSDLEIPDPHFGRVGGYDITATTTGLVITRIEDEKRLDSLESNGFSFYIDGYTIALEDESDPEHSELLCTAPDGRTCIIKKSSLTAFIERRINE